MNLRPYQTECLQSLVKLAKAGVKRQLVALPTGCGKTVIFSQIPNMAKGRRVLVLAHRTELLGQAAASLLTANPGITVDVEQAERHASRNAQVVVASVQTLAVGPERLGELDPSEFGVVIVDEAHHSIAKSYLRIFRHFGLGPDPDQIPDRALSAKKLSTETRNIFSDFKPSSNAPYLFGFTATPHRTDGIGLEAIFDEIALSRSIKEMMVAGWLCDVRAVRLETGVSIANVKTRMGDYAENQLAEAVNQQPRNETIVNSYLALAAGRQAICFCVDVEHTEAVLEEFHRANVKAGMVVGSTPKEVRAATIRAYRSGGIQVLVNCMVLTEGFDAPETSCIIMGRPTKSSLMYTQMIGRGTRIHPDKKDLLVIDLVDIGAAGINTVNTLFGLPPKLALADVSVLEAEEDLEELKGEMPFDLSVLAEAKSVAEIKELAREVSPFEAAAMLPSLPHKLAWVRTSYGYALGLRGGGSVGIVLNHLGQGTVKYKESRIPSYQIAFGRNDREAVSLAEAWVRERQPEAYQTARKDASWRHSLEPATSAQCDYARWLGITFPEWTTKGQASVLIDAAKAKKGGM